MSNVLSHAVLLSVKRDIGGREDRELSLFLVQQRRNGSDKKRRGK